MNCINLITLYVFFLIYLEGIEWKESLSHKVIEIGGTKVKENVIKYLLYFPPS